jgi:hypothetical protein
MGDRVHQGCSPGSAFGSGHPNRSLTSSSENQVGRLDGLGGSGSKIDRGVMSVAAEKYTISMKRLITSPQEKSALRRNPTTYTKG